MLPAAHTIAIRQQTWSGPRRNSQRRRAYHGAMPANVTPAYKAAEAAFRRARDPEERLDCLREMYRTIPKHKGTEHIRADIKTRTASRMASTGGRT